MDDHLETDIWRKVSLAGCERDDCELQENKWDVEEESSEENELSENDAHQMFERTPKRVHQFYFVKWWPHENPNADAMIKRNEEIIENMNRNLLHITEKINDRMGDRNNLRWQCERLRYTLGGLRTQAMWLDTGLDSQQVALDRLSFANSAYSAKGFKSCLSNGEVDKQKLHFHMLHGCRSMSDEKKILREIGASQKKDVGITVEDLDAPIRNASRQLYSNNWYQRNQTESKPMDREAVLKEINRFVIAKEKAIANAAANGKLWNSLGSKKELQNRFRDTDSERFETYMDHQQAVRGRIRGVEKRMARIEKSIASMQKQQMETCCRKDEAYESILSLKKKYGEKNARFYQYRLLLKQATALAERKDIAALQELSRKEMEDFMSEWNGDIAFREDYKRRIVPSLNARGLGKDGRRTKNGDEMSLEDKPQKNIKPEALSKSRLKWLMKDRVACYPSSSMVLALAQTRENERFRDD